MPSQSGQARVAALWLITTGMRSSGLIFIGAHPVAPLALNSTASNCASLERARAELAALQSSERPMADALLKGHVRV